MKAFPMTFLLVISLVILYSVELSRHAIGNDAALLSLGAISDAAGPGRDLWRLVTYAWLHANWTHFLLNTGLLYWTGRIVERRIGSIRMLGVYLVAVLGGGVGIAIRAALHPKPGISLGASAACFALLACAIVLLYRPDAARFGQPAGIRNILILIAIGGIAVSFAPGISLVGHVTGLVIGGLAGAFTPLAPPALDAPSAA
jgi:membrane associated rhomboid family serine protease